MAELYRETFGDGPPIALVHGWGMHSGIWHAFAKTLSTRYRVTIIDLPGHGRSPKLIPFTLENISQALAEIVDEPCCWVGWSMGATIVMDFAARWPKTCHSLILLAGNPHFVRTDRWPGMSVSAFKAFADILETDFQNALLRFLSLQATVSPNAKALTKALRQAVANAPAPDPETLLQGLKILKETDARPMLRQLNLPIAAVLGGKDGLVPSTVGPALQQLKPDLQLSIIKEAGHMPFLSHPLELLAFINRFYDL
jgi:pimeloyl-[acyl-carrier protein] methyl ester esterase